ncbi:hypothetical protein EZV62_017170 [Acer yangbiense]|uniref:NB-ARC domain-containing protein n=1 Tax=Acer yangbiense TaxID=1000413 RepID=A0A5C7HFW1_9ROSI|nr:hypothetical protein EZV62_017170 [Acer yangbiense]
MRTVAAQSTTRSEANRMVDEMTGGMGLTVSRNEIAVHLPSNLKRLTICFCSNLVTVLDEEQVSGSCNNTSCQTLPDRLGKMELSSCSNLATLTSTGNLPKAVRYHSIQRFSINDCEKLETLPCNNNLISLKKLEIWKCPAMVSIPEGGFPTSLTSLVLVDTDICKSLFEWGLNRLTSLEVLEINGGCPDVMSFPQEEIGMILPVSLKSLHISHFPNLERISSIAQNLTCLEKLTISYCPKLKYFPDDGLPQSLKQYGIMDCPLLEERCKEGEGLYWSMIGQLSDRVSRSFDHSDYTSQSEEE